MRLLSCLLLAGLLWGGCESYEYTVRENEITISGPDIRYQDIIRQEFEARGWDVSEGASSSNKTVGKSTWFGPKETTTSESNVWLKATTEEGKTVRADIFKKTNEPTRIVITADPDSKYSGKVLIQDTLRQIDSRRNPKCKNRQFQFHLHKVTENSENPNRYTGTWSSEGGMNNRSCVNIHWHSDKGRHFHSISRKDLQQTDQPKSNEPGAIRFLLDYPAGTMTLTGYHINCHGSGEFSLLFNPDYFSEIQSLVSDDIGSENQTDLFFAQLELDYARQMTEAIGKKLKIKELRKLNNYRVRPESLKEIKAAGYELSIDKIIKLKNYRIKTEYIKGVKDAGYSLSLDKIIELNNYRIPVDFMKILADAGYTFSVDELIRLRNYRVKPEDMIAFRDAGYDFSIDEIIRANNYRVSVEFAAEVAAMKCGYDLDDLIKLRNYRIEASFIKTFKEAGYDFSIDQLIKANNYRVKAEQAKKLAEAGYRFSLDDLIKLKQYNVPTDFMLKVIQEGYEPFTAEELVDFKRKNISAEQIRKIRSQKQKS